MPQYKSKERVERDGVLVYAEGDDIPESDTDELERQGYPTDGSQPDTRPSPERVERDGYLVVAEGDPVVVTEDTPTQAQPSRRTAKKAAKTTKKAAG